MEQNTLFGQEPPRPLAARLRPQCLEEYVGQTHLLGEGKLLRRLIETDQLASMIFWGPPGVGKTTLAQVIAHATKAEFSAVTGGIKEIRAIMQQAESNRRFGTRTIVFVDEIHRFNKAQQDAFLPFVEKGSILLIGATTENPSFEVNDALLSRCKVFVLHALTSEELVQLLNRALQDPRGFGAHAGAHCPFCQWRRANRPIHPGNGGPQRSGLRQYHYSNQRDPGTVHRPKVPSLRQKWGGTLQSDLRPAQIHAKF